MTTTVNLASHVWAISSDGTLRHTSITNIEWQTIKGLSAPPSVIGACEQYNAIYAACKDGFIHALDPESGTIRQTTPTRLHELPLCMLPLGMENALFVGFKDGAIVRLHLNTLEFDCMLGIGVEHAAAVHALDADERFLYSGGYDGTILVWDLREANAVREISMPSAPIQSLLRVNAALWIGLANGAVEVYDIFGEDTNGIECIARKSPHDTPIVDLVRIGEHEVWSVSKPGSAFVNLDIGPSQAPQYSKNSNVAVWDVRDFTFQMSELLTSNDILSVTILDRQPFEQVSFMALSERHGTQILSTKARGLTSDEAVENTEIRVMELEQQLADANDEIDALRASGYYVKTPEHTRRSDDVPADEITEVLAEPLRATMSHTDEGDSRRYGENPANEMTVSEPYMTPLAMKNERRECLKTSLHRLSEFLVSLLADEVLSPHEYGPTEPSEIRKTIAEITKELDHSKQLIDLCEGDYSDNTGSSAPNENDPGVLRTPQKNENLRKTVSELQKKLEEETDKNRRLQKEYEVVSKERNLFAEDIKQLKSQTENTMSSLGGIIRDRTSTLGAKDALISELRKEIQELGRECNEEKSRRHAMEKSLDEKFENLSRAAEQTAKTFEEQLIAAYDKIERKSIEIQSQKDTLRAAERQVEYMKVANQALEKKSESLEKEVEKTLEGLEQLRLEHDAKDALMQTEHNATIAALKEDHIREMELLRKSRVNVDEKNALLRQDSETERRSAETVLHSVKLRLEQTERDLQRSRSQADSLEARYRQRCQELETALQEVKKRLASEKSSWEFNIRQAENKAQLELRDTLFRREEELRDRESVIDRLEKRLQECRAKDFDQSQIIKELREESSDLQAERKLLLEEIEHRRRAESLFQKEAEKMTFVINNLRKAAEELEESFNSADAENNTLRAEIDELYDKLRAREHRIRELESKVKVSRAYAGDGGDSEDDINQAKIALLESANCEIERLCEQIEALEKTHRAQEKELQELREAVSLRDETIRLKNARLDAATENRELQPIDSPGLSMTVTPIAQNLSGDRGAMLRNQSRAAVAAWMFQSASSTRSKVALNNTLLELHEGVTSTHERLRDLTNMARKYKQLAQLHLEVLPILHELERELYRISKKERTYERDLCLARGVVQSAIAQYYSASEKRALLHECDESLYEPSPRRYAAMIDTLAELQLRRKGLFRGSRNSPAASDRASANVGAGCGSVEFLGTQATRRLLTFN